MPRIARVIAPGFPHYVTQRGNNRQDVFFDDEDRAVYLFLLKKYSDTWSIPILGYCLMANHVHLLGTPSSEESLQKMMQGITLCYTQHINRKYQRSGRLWASRYCSCIVDQDAYLWAVARYVEQNPVRAAMVESPEDYLFSSARVHMGLDTDAVITDGLFPEERRKEYISFLGAGIPESEIQDIRRSSSTGRPLGTEEFVRRMEQSLGRRLVPLPVGRPRNGSRR